jgi:squalene cyclase
MKGAACSRSFHTPHHQLECGTGNAHPQAITAESRQRARPQAIRRNVDLAGEKGRPSTTIPMLTG